MNEPRNLPDALDAKAVADLLSRSAPLTIIDVRTPAEFGSAHIAGSYNVPLDLLPEHASAISAAVGEPVIVVCRSGARALQAEQALRAADLPRLHILEGGLTAWEAAGLPLNRGRQRWSLERQVRGAAGSLVLAGVLGGLIIWPPLGLLAAGVGAGLAFSAITDTCGLALLLGKLPYNQGSGCDIGAALRDMASADQPASPGSARHALPSPFHRSLARKESSR